MKFDLTKNERKEIWNFVTELLEKYYGETNLLKTASMVILKDSSFLTA